MHDMDYSKKTLGEMLSSANETIRRNATSILKCLQKKTTDDICRYCGENMYTTVRAHHHTEIIGGVETDVTK